MSEQTAYTPKVGDRVRITTRTLEGEVVRATFNDDEGYLQQVCLKGDDGFYGWVSCNSSYVTVEKLPDPEPVWVNGDVIWAGGQVWMRSGGAWRSADKNGWVGGQLITNYWNQGSVTTLYKHDA